MEIIQPWQLYLILQADNIGSMVCHLAGVAAFTAFALTILIVIGSVVYAVSSGETGIAPSTLRGFKWPLLLFYSSVAGMQLLSALVPSTKTAAIMFGVPAVINNPTFQQETGEVYQLLKKALSDIVQKKEQEKAQ